MSRDISPDVKAIRLFLTEPHACSYLQNQQATTAFVDPGLKVDQNLYSYFSGLGFRRSGRYIYAPRCKHCNACIPARIPVGQFKPNRQQRRCRKQNADLSIWLTRMVNESEHYPLYQQYLNSRHADGDMYPPTIGQYRDFISNIHDYSAMVEIRLKGELVAAGLVDILNDGLSAIYTYYSPRLSKRSLGTFSILAELMLARELGFPYLYLGYWIKESPKMAYKDRYQPLELLRDGEWAPMN
ncbi:arginyltransferase [Porticoccus sp.]|uniref:arginyltransferase n=1 Tax=Porticoccus sp. TaxID=2024853 RepID=UPI0025FE3275|nr:arginyltransferase [Porticoccus sp.]|tara:strand:+ start:1194 stop:1916 length:723 start_codon:yes stop_codon:yes gene_type:complete